MYNVATLGRRRTRAMEIFAPAVARGLLWIFGIRLRIHGREHCEYGAATMHLRLRVARELARFPGLPSTAHAVACAHSAHCVQLEALAGDCV